VPAQIAKVEAADALTVPSAFRLPPPRELVEYRAGAASRGPGRLPPCCPTGFPGRSAPIVKRRLTLRGTKHAWAALPVGGMGIRQITWWGVTVNRSADYFDRAIACKAVAHTTNDPARRAELSAMTRMWLRLAVQASCPAEFNSNMIARISRQHGHPCVPTVKENF